MGEGCESIETTAEIIKVMLKLLAVRVEKECKECIKRCLVPDLIYYLCYDYEITQSLEGVWHISKRDAYINLVDEDFYKLSPDSDININISAIVGENGSGKRYCFKNQTF